MSVAMEITEIVWFSSACHDILMSLCIIAWFSFGFFFQLVFNKTVGLKEDPGKKN